MPIRTSTWIAPEGRWWSPVGRDERVWVLITVVWALTMFAMMQLIWPTVGDVNHNIESYRVAPAEFRAQVDGFIDEYQTGELRQGVPVVAPPPGSDVYLMGTQFQFRPILELQRGEEYRLLLSSADVQHGLSIQPGNINLQVLPTYVMAIRVVPEKSGTYTVVCNEYCGTGHHAMLGQIIVHDETTAMGETDR